MTQELVPHPVASLTAAEFLAQVESSQPYVAVFDCDGTLWAGDAGVGFMHWSMESGLLSREAGDWIDARYRAYLRGEVSELAICGEMAQIYRDLRETELRQAAHTFFQKTIRPQIFPELAELCHRLHSKGVTLWAVSSTNNWLIEDAVRDFGIPPERVLATSVRVVNGLITEELIDVPTDEGKAESLVRHGVEDPDAVFGNSIHDAAMLAIARTPFAVNPTVTLIELAAAQGWPIFQPAPIQAGLSEAGETPLG
ncbi:MAG: haloacid dehalogenase-like hydrolase [Acidobacteriaceae bacterium]